MSWKKVCVVSLLFIIMLVPGCVSKSAYEKAQADLTTAQQSLSTITADRDATKTQLSKVESDLTAAQQSLSKTQSDLATAQQSLSTVTADRDAAKAQLSQAQADLAAAQQSLATLNSSVETAQPYVDIATGYLNLALAGLNGSETDAAVALVQIMVGLSAANDPALTAAWDAFEASASTADNIAFVELLTQRLNETKPKTN